MRKQILAAATALALAAGQTTSAMAFDHKAAGDSTGRHSTHIGAAGPRGMHVARAKHISRFARVTPRQGWEARSPYGHGGYKDLGPLGVTFGCVSGYCGQGYSVSAWSY